MKISRLYIFLLFFVMNTTACEKPNFGPGLGDASIYIPNVITVDAPDNNIFYVRAESLFGPEVEFTVELMEIFDRNGSPIFKAEDIVTNDPTIGWDGHYDGEYVESGAYSYLIRIGNESGSRLFAGDLTVIR